MQERQHEERDPSYPLLALLGTDANLVEEATAPAPRGRGKSKSPRTKAKEKAPATWQEQKLKAGEYYNDPVAFATELLGVALWHKQQEVLATLADEDNRRVSVKSGNGLGKGFLAGCCVLWWMATRDPAICITTAPTSRQGRFVLWRQIHTLYNRAPGIIGGTMLESRLDYHELRYATAVTADGATQFQGFHSPHLLIIVDEAMGVTEDIFEGIEGMMTSEGPKLLLLGNPTGVSGAFYRSFHRESAIYNGITFNALDSPNVVAGETVWPGLTTAEWVEGRKLVWGEESPLYRSRVLGEFPEVGEGGLFNMRAVDEACARRIQSPPGSLSVLGVDVARYGDDSSCISWLQGNNVIWSKTVQGYNTMQVADWVIATMRQVGDVDMVGIDVVGVGAGVFDRLDQLRIPGIVPINVGRPPNDRQTYQNQRAEGYSMFRSLIERGELTLPPKNERLVEELADIRYVFSDSGHLAIESKADLKARGGWSPDVADSILHALLAVPNFGPTLYY